MQIVRSILRIAPSLVGILLVYAGIYKLVLPGEATYALRALAFSQKLATGIVIASTTFELYLGLVLLLKKDLRFALVATTMLFFIFTAFLWYLATLAHPPACGCLGLSWVFESSRSAAVFGLLRNCLILWFLKASYEYYFKSPLSRPEKT